MVSALQGMVISDKLSQFLKASFPMTITFWHNDPFQREAPLKGTLSNDRYRGRYSHVCERLTSLEGSSWNASQRSTGWDVLQWRAFLEGSCSNKTYRGRYSNACQPLTRFESLAWNQSQRPTQCDVLQRLALFEGTVTNEFYGLRRGDACQRLALPKGAWSNDCQGLRQSDTCQVVALYNCVLVDNSHRLWYCHRKRIFTELEGNVFNFRNMGRNGNMQKVLFMDVVSCCRFNLFSGVNNHHVTSSTHKASGFQCLIIIH